MGAEPGTPTGMSEGRAQHLLRVDASGRPAEHHSNGGTPAAGAALPESTGLHPLRLHPQHRRLAGQLLADGGGSGEHLQNGHQQQGYLARDRRLTVKVVEPQRSGGSPYWSDEEKGGGGIGSDGGGRGNSSSSGGSRLAAARAPGTPMTPGTRRRNGRLALLSMLLLVFQGTALSIMLRFSRARSGQPYLASVSVIFTEVIKLLICITMQLRVCMSDTRQQQQQQAAAAGNNGGLHPQHQQAALLRELRRQARDIAAKSLPMLLPAGMFVMQQVLLIIAATHLDAVAFQIFSQSFKLVPTAVFAYLLLGQQLEAMQWASIPVLAGGVILVTLNNGGGSSAGQSAAAAAVSSSSSGLDYVAGMVACSVSGLSSAYAGVYFEKYVKGKHAASLWVRNIQLGMYGVPLSTAYAVVKDGSRIRSGGLMQGFDAATWIVIALQVFGGLVTGMVVKYCDNILKNFALAVSVILTVLVAIPLFGQWPSTFFLLGVSLVLLSVFMYGRALPSLEARLALWWQWARKRLVPWRMEDGSSSRRLLFVFLFSCCAAGLLLTGFLSAQTGAGSLPLRQHGQDGFAGSAAASLATAGGGGGGSRQATAHGSGASAGIGKGAAGSGGKGGGDSEAGLRRRMGLLLNSEQGGGTQQRQQLPQGGRRR